MIIMTSLGKWERFGRQTCMSARTLLPLVLLLTGGLVGSCMWDEYRSHLFFCPTRQGPVLVRERYHSTCRSKGCLDGIGDQMAANHRSCEDCQAWLCTFSFLMQDVIGRQRRCPLCHVSEPKYNNGIVSSYIYHIQYHRVSYFKKECTSVMHKLLH